MNRKILTKRVPDNQYARTFGIGKLAVRVGTKMAKDAILELARGKRPDASSLFLSKGNFEEITSTLATMRGAAMKLGQIASMDSGDLLPSDLSHVLSRLRAQGHAMPPQQLRRILNQNWGYGWLNKFRQFDVRPFAAASIGQVHKAVSKEGQNLAIKVQFPNIKQSIHSDLRNIQIIAKSSGLLPETLDIDHYLEICKAQLLLETDYVREADFLRRFHALASSTNGIQTPVCFAKFSTKSVLAMSLEEGVDLDCLDQFSKDDKNRIALLMVDWAIREVFEFKLVQTDPNFANYRYDVKSASIKLLDFGACIEPSPNVIRIYSELAASFLANDIASLIDTLAKYNLMPTEMPITAHNLVEKVLNVALREFHASDTFSFSDSKVFDYINAENVGEISTIIPTDLIPADLLFMQRKFLGLMFLLRRLGASLPLKSMLQKQINLTSLKPRFYTK